MLLLTNNGIFLPNQFTLAGTLAITDRVERDFIVFDSFKEFFSYIKSKCIDKEFEDDRIGEKGIYVGYCHHTYITNFGQLVYSVGTWMDDHIRWEQRGKTYFLSSYVQKESEYKLAV